MIAQTKFFPALFFGMCAVGDQPMAGTKFVSVCMYGEQAFYKYIRSTH
jgi:hypothetical protein